ncbi:uncharacterized protein LOC115580620 [Sparus aurata]|uniref:uncharacterized protein LOC115580620 n=1 Tax=Sparus aurata TaxID=8175 RepID=UPI0011C1A1CF|nr:uncharacterized protein LOC115580620 [Sparus aurata]
MAQCYFGRVLAYIWLTSQKGNERDHNVFERVRIHDFTGALWHPSGLPKVCTETGNFLTVTRDRTSFLGVITGEQQQSSSMAETAAAQPISPPYHGYMRGCNQMCGTLLKEVLVNQQILMDQQKNIIRMIQDMQRSTNAVTGIPTTNVFPLNDKPALYALERDLGSQPDLRNKLVITLGLVGGATVKETVWRILKQASKMILRRPYHGAA